MVRDKKKNKKAKREEETTITKEGNKGNKTQTHTQKKPQSEANLILILFQSLFPLFYSSP